MFKLYGGLPDMVGVSQLMDNANKILDAAESMRVAGHKGSDWSILVGSEGAIHMVSGSDWPLDSLRAHHGATQAYRVVQQNNQIQVEGKDERRAIVIRSHPPNHLLKLLLPERRDYHF